MFGLVPGDAVVFFLPAAVEDGWPVPAHWRRGVLDDVQPACRDFVRVDVAGVRRVVPAKLVRPEEGV